MNNMCCNLKFSDEQEDQVVVILQAATPVMHASAFFSLLFSATLHFFHIIEKAFNNVAYGVLSKGKYCIVKRCVFK
jgi:hypothetical protein